VSADRGPYILAGPNVIAAEQQAAVGLGDDNTFGDGRRHLVDFAPIVQQGSERADEDSMSTADARSTSSGEARQAIWWDATTDPPGAA
jgi:hypothetical protein